jgi:hypothetical protein
MTDSLPAGSSPPRISVIELAKIVPCTRSCIYKIAKTSPDVLRLDRRKGIPVDDAVAFLKSRQAKKAARAEVARLVRELAGIKAGV